MRLSARIKCFRYLVYAYIVLISVSWKTIFCLSSLSNGFDATQSEHENETKIQTSTYQEVDFDRV